MLSGDRGVLDIDGLTQIEDFLMQLGVDGSARDSIYMEGQRLSFERIQAVVCLCEKWLEGTGAIEMPDLGFKMTDLQTLTKENLVAVRKGVKPVDDKPSSAFDMLDRMVVSAAENLSEIKSSQRTLGLSRQTIKKLEQRLSAVSKSADDIRDAFNKKAAELSNI